MPLGRITQPTLIVSHRDDGCAITPASDATKLQKRLGKARPVKVVILSGGAKPRSGPCKARSQHGFLGIEGKTVATIADFINKHPKPGTKN
jgi:pimeloyl-ACP methyl ester carboxylesterase